MSDLNTNEQLGLSGYTDKQLTRFSLLCQRVKNKEITANQAYKYSMMDGEEEDNKGFRGSLKQWIELAQEKGWLEPVYEIKQPTTEPVIVENKTNYFLPIAIGVVAAVVLVMVIKNAKKEG